ncbi:carbohydrate kinase [Sphaerisporangium sp. NBC_01403]|uniref:FGGY family carbohydrate kinase n=1 Tax=Sphaerisporangium sp. NBC_01403 TaxID=2903599 RepID=UPI003246B66E
MIVGVDVGTSVTKAVAFTLDGEVTAVAARPTVLRHPASGQVEQDAEQVFRSVEGVLANLAVEGPLAMGITGQGDGLWPLDAAGTPAAPAISWMDGRAAGFVDAWMADGTFETLFRRTGNAPFPGAGAPLLAWLDRFRPGLLDRTATVARCKDMVMQRLTGVRVTDMSDASNLFTDPRTGRRDLALLEVCGLGHRAGLLPPIADSGPAAPGPPVGELLAPVGGLPPGLPVSAGPYDLPACAAGAGVAGPGEGLLIIGTTLACQVHVDRLDLGGEPAGQTLLYGGSGGPGGWLRAMPAMTGTAALDWVLRLVGAGHDELDGLLAASPPGAHGVRFLPFLSAGGERAPFVDPGVRGRLDGLELARSRADVVRAACEGLAFAARHCFDAAGLTGEVAVCGGGTASEAWLQIFADALGRPLRLARGPEVGARGAALVAARRFGLALDEAAWTRGTRWYEPRHDREDGYHRYLDDVAALRAM